MPVAPVHKLKKKEIMWLADHYCKHGHRYLEHFNCFLDEVVKDKKWEPGKGNIPSMEKIGFFDIESTGFQATFSIMICYCIKDSVSGDTLGKCITPKELKTCLDYNVVKQCVEDLKKFDRVVGFYSTKFDLPFLRSRAVYHKIPFPHYKELYHTDVYYIIKHRFKLHSNRQETAYNMLVGESHKTHFGRDHWLRGPLQGNQESLSYIYDHCKIDVAELEELFHTVEDFSQKRDTSI